jgi:hypothetical protein
MYISDGKYKYFAIHRAMAWTFIGPQVHGIVVNHKDGNKHNNHISNLEYATRSQDRKHAWDNKLIPSSKNHNWGRKGINHHGAKITDDDVRFIRNNFTKGKPHSPQPEWNGENLAKRFGVTKAMISRIVNRKAWTHVID